MLRPSEAAIYGRFGYGPATHGAQLRCEKRSMIFRPGTEFGDGTIRLLGHDEARPLIEKVYDQVRTGAVGRPDRPDGSWDSRLFDEPQAREGATALRFAVHQEPGGHVTAYALYRTRSAVDVFGDNKSTVQVMEFVTTCPRRMPRCGASSPVSTSCHGSSTRRRSTNRCRTC